MLWKLSKARAHIKYFAVLEGIPNICNIELASLLEAPMFDKICRSVAEAFNMITVAR